MKPFNNSDDIEKLTIILQEDISMVLQKVADLEHRITECESRINNLRNV